MKGNKIFYAGIAILILGIGFAVGTYAYYQTTINGTASGTVLAWECTANGQTASFDYSMGSLYPGSAGSIPIALAATIDSDFAITVEEYTSMGSGSNHPYLKLYADSAHTTALNETDTISTNNGDFSASYNSSTHKYEASATLYYYWPYGTGAGEQGAEDYNSASPSATLTIVCTQK